MTWENANTNSFARYTQYTNSSGEIVSDWSDEDPTIESDGAFYEWNTPCLHIAPLSDANLFCQIRATLMVQNYGNYTQYLTVYSRYAHKKLSLNFSFSISPAEKGVDLGADFVPGIQVAYYPHYFTWDFATVARQAGEY